MNPQDNAHEAPSADPLALWGVNGRPAGRHAAIPLSMLPAATHEVDGNQSSVHVVTELAMIGGVHAIVRDAMLVVEGDELAIYSGAGEKVWAARLGTWGRAEPGQLGTPPPVI